MKSLTTICPRCGSVNSLMRDWDGSRYCLLCGFTDVLAEGVGAFGEPLAASIPPSAPLLDPPGRQRHSQPGLPIRARGH